MQTGLPRLAVPAVDVGQSGRFGEGAQQRFAVHVAPNGQAKQGEDGGRDVQQAGAKHQLIAFDARAHHGEDAEMSVLIGWACRFIGQVLRAQVVAVEPVVGNDDDGGFIVDQFQIRAQHQVMKLIAGVHHVLVQLKISLFHPIQTRRVVFHETVAKMVDAVEIHAHEIPGFQLHQCGGGGVDAGIFSQILATL